MVEQIFLSPQVKQSVVISNKLAIASTLENKEISGKSQNFIELLRSASSFSRKDNFVSTSKNLLKNRN